MEAILLTASFAVGVAAWGVLTNRWLSRRQATMEFFRQSASDKDIISAREKFISATLEEGGLAKYACTDPLNPDRADAETQQGIRTVLNHYEMLAVGVQFGCFDLDIIRRYFRSTIMRDWQHAAPFVYKVRSDLKSDTIYHELEELARWLRDHNMPKRTRWKKLWF